jgi:hypothetical protein
MTEVIPNSLSSQEPRNTSGGATVTKNIAPDGWPSNLGTEERRKLIADEITAWVGNLRLDAALSAKELGQYSGMHKALLLRNGLLVGAIRHCRLNPLADTRLSVLTIITFLADNNYGICRLSVTRMCEMFARSREAIVNSITSLEADGQIGVNRKQGMPNCYWPLIPSALAELSANPIWFVDALSHRPKARVFRSVEEAIASAAHDQSSPLDQSSNPDKLDGALVKDRRGTGQGSSSSISLRELTKKKMVGDHSTFDCGSAFHTRNEGFAGESLAEAEVASELDGEAGVRASLHGPCAEDRTTPPSAICQLDSTVPRDLLDRYFACASNWGLRPKSWAWLGRGKSRPER